MFKTRAAKVSKALTDAGFTVTVNGDKPRKGAFVVKQLGQPPLIELLNMKRPFTALRELDLDAALASLTK